MLPDLNALFKIIFYDNFRMENLKIRSNNWLTAGDTVPILENAFYFLNGLMYQQTRKIKKYLKLNGKKKLHEKNILKTWKKYNL